jgi:hypothetical protein
MKWMVPLLVTLAGALTAFAGVSERVPVNPLAGVSERVPMPPLAGVSERVPASPLAGTAAPPGKPAQNYRSAAAKPAQPAAERRRSLRCWQQGRLILDEPIAAMPSGVAPHGHVFEGKGSAPDMQLLDLQHAACLIR